MTPFTSARLKIEYRETLLDSKRAIVSQTKTRRHDLLAARSRGGDVEIIPNEKLKAEPKVAVG